MKEKSLTTELWLFERKLGKACEKAKVRCSKPYEKHVNYGITIRHYKDQCYEEVVHPNGYVDHQYIESVKSIFIPLTSQFVHLWRHFGGDFHILLTWVDSLMKYFAPFSFYKLIDLLGMEYNRGPALSYEERLVLKRQLGVAMLFGWPEEYKEGIDLDDYDSDFGITNNKTSIFKIH